MDEDALPLLIKQFHSLENPLVLTLYLAGTQIGKGQIVNYKIDVTCYVIILFTVTFDVTNTEDCLSTASTLTTSAQSIEIESLFNTSSSSGSYLEETDETFKAPYMIKKYVNVSPEVIQIPKSI